MGRQRRRWLWLWVVPLLLIAGFVIWANTAARPMPEALAAGSVPLQAAWHDPSRITLELIAGYRKAASVTNRDQAFWEFTLASELLGLAAQVTAPTSHQISLSRP